MVDEELGLATLVMLSLWLHRLKTFLFPMGISGRLAAYKPKWSFIYRLSSCYNASYPFQVGGYCRNGGNKPKFTS